MLDAWLPSRRREERWRRDYLHVAGFELKNGDFLHADGVLTSHVEEKTGGVATSFTRQDSWLLVSKRRPAASRLCSVAGLLASRARVEENTGSVTRKRRRGPILFLARGGRRKHAIASEDRARKYARARPPNGKLICQAVGGRFFLFCQKKRDNKLIRETLGDAQLILLLCR